MKLRIRNTHKNRAARTVEEKANILAYNIWQIALAGTKNLHAEDYRFDGDEQRVGVIREYLIFLLHIADRMAHTRLSDEERETFIATLAKDTAYHLQRNTEEIMGSGDYKAPYFELINERFGHYATGKFEGDEPGYSLYRMIGDNARTIMGDDQINKWTIDQIMDIDGPEMVEKMQASLESILDTPSVEETAKTSVDLLLEN